MDPEGEDDVDVDDKGEKGDQILLEVTGAPEHLQGLKRTLAHFPPRLSPYCDHFLGRAEGTEENLVRFIFQTPPTYSYTNGSSWITALILSIILGLGLILAGIFLVRSKMAA